MVLRGMGIPYKSDTRLGSAFIRRTAPDRCTLRTVLKRYYRSDGMACLASRDARGESQPEERDSWLSWSDKPGVPLSSTSDTASGRSQDDMVSALSDLASSLSSLDGEEDAWQQPRIVDYDSKEKVFLVAAALKSSQQSKKVGYSIIESLEELGRLAETAGLEVVGYTYQLLDFPNPRTYVGTGKVAEIAEAIRDTGAETVLFDDELSPGQMRNLEKALGKNVRLCDRTALILDIFSQRAATREGKLQVELAQAEYQLPRLTRMWSHLERQTSGGGQGGQVKGMGEKQIEVDRRLLRNQAAKLRRQIEEVRGHRKAYRERRASAPIPVIALVGYTNAGKSSLLNTLTDAGVVAEDQLFATLDPTTRRVIMRGGQEIGWCANDSHFTVTEAGEREYLRLRPPRKLTRSQQRYEQYLREDSCMKFGEWLKCQAYKREVAW